MNTNSSAISKHRFWFPPALIVALGFLGLCYSHADEVDNYVKRQMQRYNIPGLSLAVVQNGKVVKAKGYGLADVELHVSACKDTVYEIGSVTKVFTATAVMMLVTDGAIGLNDKITKYVSGLPENWNSVTIRHLLTHTSGITNDYAEVSPKEYRSPFSVQRFLHSMAGSSLNSEPGEKFAYSNSGYYLLGLIIEKTSGKSYGDFMKDRIFVPLGMPSTRMNDLDLVITNRAKGYAANSLGGLRNRDYMDPSWPFSAGSLLSSVVDMAKWDTALDTGMILPKARLEEMFTPARLNDGSIVTYVGLGWGINTNPRCGRELTHFGQTPGFVAGIGRWIDQRLTVIVLANKQEVPSWDIVAGVSGRYLPDLNKPIQDGSPELTKKGRELLVAAIAGKLDPQQFTDDMRSNFFHKKADYLCKETKGLGRMKSFILVEEGVNKQEHYSYRRYRARFAKESLRFYLELNDDQRISDFRVVFD